MILNKLFKRKKKKYKTCNFCTEEITGNYWRDNAKGLNFCSRECVIAYTWNSNDIVIANKVRGE